MDSTNLTNYEISCRLDEILFDMIRATNTFDVIFNSSESDAEAMIDDNLSAKAAFGLLDSHKDALSLVLSYFRSLIKDIDTLSERVFSSNTGRI